MPATLDELAARFGCRLEGSGAIAVDRVATLANAGERAISFLANPLYRDLLATTGAAAVILDEASADGFAGAKLICPNPYAVYARVANYLHPPAAVVPGIDPSASVAATAKVAETAEVGPLVAIGPRASIGAGAVIGAGCVIGADAVIGPGTRLAPRVAVLDRVTVGARCIVHSGAVIGSDGYGFAPDGGAWVKVPQLGTVEIGDDVEIGANTTVDRGAIEATVIENGVKLDNLVQIAHNVRLGEHTVMAAMSGAAGSTRIGKRCLIAGGVAIIGHLEICDDVMFTVRSIVTKSVTVPGVYGGGLPAEEGTHWNRNAARFRKLDTMSRRLRALERAAGPVARTNKATRTKKDEEHD
jgi:UDP-3-O-[3-hydroxymyristoyl] glucosamine N-acyltransferase